MGRFIEARIRFWKTERDCYKTIKDLFWFLDEFARNDYRNDMAGLQMEIGRVAEVIPIADSFVFITKDMANVVKEYISDTDDKHLLGILNNHLAILSNQHVTLLDIRRVLQNTLKSKQRDIMRIQYK